MKQPFITKPPFIFAFFLLSLFLISCEVKIERRKQLTDANISMKNFTVSQDFGLIAGDTMRLFANGQTRSDKFPLKPGTYTLLIYAKGTQAYSVYPKVKVYLNTRLIGEPQLSADYAMSAVTFNVEKEETFQIN